MAQRAATSKLARRSARQLPLAVVVAAGLSVGAAWLVLDSEPQVAAPRRVPVTQDVAEVAVATLELAESEQASEANPAHPAYGAPRAGSTAPVPSAASPVAPSLVAPRAPAEPPASVAGVLALSPAEVDAPTLVGWVARADLEPQLRYAALRRLEQLSPRQAVQAAIERLEDPASLVRTNALAVLARSRDPDARRAIEGLDPRRREVAARIAAGRS